MIDPRPVSILLRIVLNATDVVTSFFLIVGGLNATLRSATFGYLCVGFGLALLYLSTGMWTKGKWKLVTRLALYVGTSCVVVIVLLSFLLVRHQPLGKQAPLPAVLLFLLISVALSAIHFRIFIRRNVDM